ncbi:hypothetical protein [Longispora albida]|uniref:hypothetical protein n=1 Tax=Longispora albida TaxID=203523 RepID=UPI000365914F|nr:hypothetical protein [Longispora albida]
MATWSQFAESEPLLAASIQALMHQYGPGMAYLATVRPDGGPRLHPVSPVIAGDGLYCFLVDSPKRRDLERDGRYALHSYPSEEVDDEAYLTGLAIPVPPGPERDRIAAAYSAAPQAGWKLFEFTVETAMHARYQRGWPPEYQTWRVPAGMVVADRVQ